MNLVSLRQTTFLAAPLNFNSTISLSFSTSSKFFPIETLKYLHAAVLFHGNGPSPNRSMVTPFMSATAAPSMTYIGFGLTRRIILAAKDVLAEKSVISDHSNPT
ncbi:hypothetical protein M5689_006268 [Euphorbia peplus]|nr:hypothetical protein M5689_006268 [Euphorbia peplus]